MPALSNRRYEAFALALFQGLSSDGPASHSAAYRAAGYTSNKQSAKVGACRLLQNCPAIVERVKELQAEVATAKKVTVESIVDELETARSIAERNGQSSAMVAASMGKGKILGLEPPAKTEVGKPGDFSQARSTKDMARAELAGLGVTDPTDEDLAAAVKLMSSYAAQFEALVQGRTDMLTDTNHPRAAQH
jgi:hypothetical protein